MAVGIRKKIKEFMSEKTNKDTRQDMENASSNQRNTENLDREETGAMSGSSSSIMSDVLDAVNAMNDQEGSCQEGEPEQRKSNSEQESDSLQAKNSFQKDAQPESMDEKAQDPIIQELKSKQSEIDKLQAELVASQDKYLRALADFENFKKRSLKERSELLKYQGEQVILDMVRVFDDLELAVQFAGNEGADTASDPQKIVEGLRMIHKNFVDALAKWDIKAESAVGKAFDPQKHMAISKVPVAEAAPGTVVSELKKVYFYKDKILRVGEVIVAAD